MGMNAIPLTRRRFLRAAGVAGLTSGLLTGLAAAGRTLAADGPAKTPYAGDVEFLLAELERQAGAFFEVKKIDWAAVTRQFRAEAKKVRTDAAHLKLCQRLVARLRDGHAALVDVKITPPDESKARRFTGPRVHLLASPGVVLVRTAFGPALEQGVQAGMKVLKIDAKPAAAWLQDRVEKLRDENGYSTDHAALYAACHWGLADWEGTKISFELEKDGRKKAVTIIRKGGPNFAPLGPVFPPKGLEQLGRQSYGKTESGLGYIHLRDVPSDLPQQLDTMLARVADAPGLVLDCRANGGGGCDHEAVFGRFLEPGKRWRQYTGQGTKPYPGPMVVIVDAGVRSAGETISGMLKEDGRALLIGDTPTAGSSSQKTRVTVPSGLFTVYFSVASNKGRFNGGKGIEGIGVAPQETVPYDARDLLAGVDTQIRRAEALLRAGLPAEKVSYKPG